MTNYKGLLLAAWLSGAGLGLAADLDMRNAVIHPALDFSGPHKKAIEMLVEEVEKRTQLRLSVSTATPARGSPVLRITRRQGPAEGYRIAVSGGSAPVVAVVGHDHRCV